MFICSCQYWFIRPVYNTLYKAFKNDISNSAHHCPSTYCPRRNISNSQSSQCLCPKAFCPGNSSFMSSTSQCRSLFICYHCMHSIINFTYISSLLRICHLYQYHVIFNLIVLYTTVYFNIFHKRDCQSLQRAVNHVNLYCQLSLHIFHIKHHSQSQFTQVTVISLVT